MKKNLLVLAAALFSMLSVQAQNFQGMAVYESKTSLGDDMAKLDGEGMTPEIKAMVQEQLKKMFEKTFVLNFDRTASTYEEEERLDDGSPMGAAFKMMGSIMGGGGKHYKNIKEKAILQEKDIFGKEFLVSDSLPVIKWTLGTETKKIGEYTCYKATGVMPVDKSNLMNYKPKEGMEEKLKEKSQEELKTTNFMDMVEMPEDKTITAWYTPEIPVSQGPENYWGLPGLILEVADDKTVLLCSKIVINPKEKKEIKAPNKGEKVTQAEFADIMMKKMQEMQEMYGTPGSGNVEFRIGG